MQLLKDRIGGGGGRIEGVAFNVAGGDEAIVEVMLHEAGIDGVRARRARPGADASICLEIPAVRSGIEK